MKTCNDCGTKIYDDNFKFCPKCGGQNLSFAQNMNSNQDQYLDVQSLAVLIYNYVYGYLHSKECIDLVGLGEQKSKGVFGSIFGPSKKKLEDRKFFYDYRTPVILASLIIRKIGLTIPSLTEKGMEAIKSAYLLTYISGRFKKEAWMRPEIREFGKDIHKAINTFTSNNDEKDFWCGDKLTKEIWLWMFNTGVEVERFEQYFKGHKQIVSLIEADFPNFYNRNIAGKIITETVGGEIVTYS